MKKGIVFVCVPTKSSAGADRTSQQRLQLVKDAGFTAWRSAPWTTWLPARRWPIRRATLASDPQRDGEWALEYPLSSPDEETRQQGVANIRQSIDTARVSGADTVLVVPGVVETTPTSWRGDRSAQHARVGALCRAARHLPGRGERGQQVPSQPAGVFALHRRVRQRQRRRLLRCGQHHDVGLLPTSADPQPGRRRKVHFKDFDVQTRQGRQLLQGSVPWQRVRQALLDVGYNDYCSVEIFPYPAYPDQFMYDCSRQVDRILAGE